MISNITNINSCTKVQVVLNKEHEYFCEGKIKEET